MNIQIFNRMVTLIQGWKIICLCIILLVFSSIMSYKYLSLNSELKLQKLSSESQLKDYKALCEAEKVEIKIKYYERHIKEKERLLTTY